MCGVALLISRCCHDCKYKTSSCCKCLPAINQRVQKAIWQDESSFFYATGTTHSLATKHVSCVYCLTMIIKMQWLLPGIGNSADRFAQVLFMMHLLLKVHCWCPIQGRRRRRFSECVYANCTNMLWRWAHYSLSKSLARRRKHTLAICGLLFDSTLLCRWQQQWAT